MLHTTKNMSKNDGSYKMNFDMAEAAKLGAATH